jgi:ABC-type lipoprotein release transport system permease subunit
MNEPTGTRPFAPFEWMLLLRYLRARRQPTDMDVGETSAVLAMALALSLLATLYPSWRAARLDPVEALRYQ